MKVKEVLPTGQLRRNTVPRYMIDYGRNWRANNQPAPLTKEIEDFAGFMAKQLEDNEKKGDRFDWIHHTPKALLEEVHWHVLKLGTAVRLGDVDGIAEFSADVANAAMMIADAYGLLTNYLCPDHSELCPVTICGENVHGTN